MTTRTHTGLLLLVLAAGLTGCDGAHPPTVAPGPTAPPAPDLKNAAPTILSVTPALGSTGGGASIRITGAGLLPGIRVAFGATTVAASFSPPYTDRIFVTSPSHALGSVDVVVTNVDGQNAVAIGAYTFAAPESFDVNGTWQGVSFAGDYDEPFTRAVRPRTFDADIRGDCDAQYFLARPNQHPFRRLGSGSIPRWLHQFGSHRDGRDGSHQVLAQ